MYRYVVVWKIASVCPYQALEGSWPAASFPPLRANLPPPRVTGQLHPGCSVIDEASGDEDSIHDREEMMMSCLE